MKAGFFNKKQKKFPDASLVIEIFPAKVLPKVNKQVGGINSNAFFSKQILTQLAACNIKKIGRAHV